MLVHVPSRAAVVVITSNNNCSNPCLFVDHCTIAHVNRPYHTIETHRIFIDGNGEIYLGSTGAVYIPLMTDSNSR